MNYHNYYSKILRIHSMENGKNKPMPKQFFVVNYEANNLEIIDF